MDSAAEVVVSRQHASISRCSRLVRSADGTEKLGYWVLRDSGSRNGTFVNYVRIANKALQFGDVVHFGGGTHAPINGPQIAGIASEFIYVFVEGPPPLEDAAQWQLVPPLEHAPATPMSDLQRRNFLERQGLHMADSDPALETALMTGFVDERIQEPGERASTRIRARVNVVAPPDDNDDDEQDNHEDEADTAKDDDAVRATGVAVAGAPSSRLTPRPAGGSRRPTSARSGVARLPGDVLISALLSSARTTRANAACPPSGNFTTPACAQRRSANGPATTPQRRTSKWALQSSPRQRRPKTISIVQRVSHRLPRVSSSSSSSSSSSAAAAAATGATAAGYSLPVVSLTAGQAWNAHQRELQMPLLRAAPAAVAAAMFPMPFPSLPQQLHPLQFGWPATPYIPWGQQMTPLGSLSVPPADSMPAPRVVCLTAPSVLSRVHRGSVIHVPAATTTPASIGATRQQESAQTAPVESARPAKRAINHVSGTAHAVSEPLRQRQPSTDKRPRVEVSAVHGSRIPSWLACSDCSHLLIGAVTLPCGHAVCTACAASGLVGKRGPLGCPSCSKPLIAAGSRLSSAQQSISFLTACRPCHSLDEAVLALLPTLNVSLQAQYALRRRQHARILKAIAPIPAQQPDRETRSQCLTQPVSGLIVPETSSLPTSPAQPSPQGHHDSEILIEEQQSLRLEDRGFGRTNTTADAFGDVSSEDSGCESNDDDDDDDDIAGARGSTEGHISSLQEVL